MSAAKPPHEGPRQKRLASARFSSLTKWSSLTPAQDFTGIPRTPLGGVLIKLLRYGHMPYGHVRYGRARYGRSRYGR